MKINILKNIAWGMLLGGMLVAVGGVIAYKVLIKIDNKIPTITRTQQVIDDEYLVTNVVEKATPSVVTISVSKTVASIDPLFGAGFLGDNQSDQKVEQDIGTGFIISADGLIVTNKHVVADTNGKYKVIVGKDEIVEVKQIYRDPANDLAILQIDKKGLTPVNMGDSDKLKVGQTVIAIGTALGEFRSTVTKGVISGLGRGSTAGSPFEGSEKLDNVIQTDAAINPGNSGGPLLNSSGEVIGVNVAVSQSANSIGFALPINIVKESINNFKTTGEFDRPFLGVAYRMISKQAALLNEVPMGGYVQSVVGGSPADKVGIKQGDIITEIDGNKLDDKFVIANYINKKKIGDVLAIKIYRGNNTIDLSVKLEKRTN